jgi:arabinan endo-1,5-alpha-L-arabinosidase
MTRALGAGAVTALALPVADSVGAQGAINAALKGDLSPVHDPCIIRQGSTYHLFCTSQMREGKGLIAWRTSPDLLNWTFKGGVMQAFPDWVMQAVPGTKGAWAPDISFVENEYRLYYAASTFGSNTSVIGLMTSPTLDTSDPAFGWKDKGLVVGSTVHDDFNAIDANLVVDAQGNHWLALGSFWTGLKLVALDPATGKPKEEKPKFLSIARRPIPPDAIEGAFIIRKGDWYYLFASYDFCCRGVDSTYYTVVCRSRNVAGPYADRDGRKMVNDGGFTVLHADLDPEKRFKGPGHCAILQDGNADYIVYHAYDAQNNGRPTLRIQKLAWTADGWPVAV